MTELNKPEILEELSDIAKKHVPAIESPKEVKVVKEVIRIE